MRTLINIIFTAILVVIISYFLPGINVNGFWSAIWVAIVLGLLNIFVKPVLVLFTLPVTIFTFGLFLLVINAVIIILCGEIVPGFHVANFWYALLFSLILSFCQSFLNGVNNK